MRALLSWGHTSETAASTSLRPRPGLGFHGGAELGTVLSRPHGAVPLPPAGEGDELGVEQRTGEAGGRDLAHGQHPDVLHRGLDLSGHAEREDRHDEADPRSRVLDDEGEAQRDDVGSGDDQDHVDPLLL